eukprot:GDKK01042961.1.p1 GENE.GDKK01042961.1~~GDKK01042961.1.p1  ORF type:complete len:642 (-),score=151.69 GDKK01042961.1:411-2336(-)
MADAVTPKLCQDASDRGYSGKTCCSIQSGDFNNPEVWDCKEVPGRDHAVIIRHNIRLTTKNATADASADPVVFVRALRLVKSNEAPFKGSVGFLRAGTLPGGVCLSDFVTSNPMSVREVEQLKKVFYQVPGVSSAKDLPSVCAALQGKSGFNGLVTREEDFEMSRTVFVSVVHPAAVSNSTNSGRRLSSSEVESEGDWVSDAAAYETENEKDEIASSSSSLRGPSASPSSSQSEKEGVDRRSLATIVTPTGTQSVHSYNAAYPVQTSLQSSQIDTSTRLWNMPTTATLTKKEIKQYSQLTNEIIIQLEPVSSVVGLINIVDPYKIIPKYQNDNNLMGNSQTSTAAVDDSPRGTSGVIVEEGASLLLLSDVTLAVEQIGPVVNNGTFFIGKARDATCASTNADQCKHPSLIAHGAIHALKPIRAHWLVVGESDYPMRAAWEGIVEYPSFMPLAGDSQLSLFGNIQVGYVHPGMGFHFSRMSAPWPALKPVIAVQNVDTETVIRIHIDVFDDDQFNGCCSDTYDESVAVFRVTNAPLVVGKYTYYAKNVGEGRDGISQQINLIAPRIEVAGYVTGLSSYIPDMPISVEKNYLNIQKAAGTDKDLLYVHCIEECTINGYKFGNKDKTAAIQIKFELPKDRVVTW